MNRGARQILPSLLILLSTSIYSQNIVFKTYTVNDGIVANPVRKVLQDSKGFLWIATWEGLSKYDGNKFTNYTTANGLSFDLINDMYEDPSGKIYLAENNGSVDIIERDRIAKDSIHKDVVVNFFKQAGNKIYAGTDYNGLLEFDRSAWSHSARQSFNTVIDFAFINDSLILIINTNLRPCLVDRQFQIYSAVQRTTFTASAVRRDSKNRIWLCTDQGLKLLAAKQEKDRPIVFESLPASFNDPLIKNQAIADFFEDVDGNYWISTLNGVVRISSNGRLQLFTTQNGLPVNIINNFYEDREKNIWMCSEAGLVKIVMKNNLEYFGRQDGLKGDQIRSMFADDNSIYLDNVSQVLKIDPKKNSVLPTTDVSLNSFCTTIDIRGHCFMIGETGIAIRSGDKIIPLHVLPFRVTALQFDDKGYLWAGTWENGLFRLQSHDNGDDTSFVVQDISYLVPDKSIRSIFMDRHANIWIGGRYNGVFRLTPLANGSYQTLHFDRENGMNSNWVKAIAEDRKGNIWIGTLQGINKLIPSENSFRIFDFSRVNHSYGAVNCIYTGIDNQIWYGGPSGLVHFNDDELDTMTAPEVFLTSVQSKDRIDMDNTDKPVLFPYNHNRINFEFSAPSFINEKEMLYSYRLRGAADTAWSSPSNIHSVSFASLSPGKYRFETRAIGWNGQPGRPAVFSFTIQKPFWQTGWFYISGLAVILIVGYLLYRYRINQLLKVQKVRDRIATDLHDDIGSSLTNINILSELSYQNIYHPEQAQKFLQRISEEVGNTSEAMDDIIWNVNSRYDSIQETMGRMRRFAAELFDNSAVEYQLELDDMIQQKKMNMEQRRDVFLMYKEMLNNVHKHSGADFIRIAVQLKENILHLDVRDNGKGFDTTAVTQRNGLKNLYQRCARWNGTVNIESGKDEGTHIHISLPFSGI